VIRTLEDTVALTGRQLTHLRRVPSKLIRVTILPVVTVGIFGYLFGGAMTVPGGNYREYIMAGIFVQVMLSGVSTTAVGMNLDVRTGITDRFRSLPMSFTAVLLGRAVADLLLSAVACTVMAAVGYLIGWRVHGGALSTMAGFGLLLATGFVLSWLGVLIGLALPSAEAVTSVTFLVTIPFTFLSNAFVPLGSLPGWLARLAEWNPVTAVVTSLHTLWGNAPIPADGSLPTRHPLAVALFTLTLLLVIVAPAALRAFRRAGT
jgi:ABC-2 type transport system permease protein